MAPKVVTASTCEALNVLGSHLQVRLSGEDTAGAYALVEQQDQAGPGVPPHVHAHEDEIFHVVEGSVEITVDGQTIVAGPGTTAYLPRGVAHGYRIVGSGLTRILIAAYPAGIERMFRELDALTQRGGEMSDAAAICARYGIRFV